MPRYTYGCPGEKRKFLTWEDAEDALDRIWKLSISGNQRSEKLPCRSYGPCEDCHGYHHTSQPYPDSYWLHLEEESA